MARVNASRVKETSLTEGTGAYDLEGAVIGFESFVTGVGDTNTCRYLATDGVDWEIGIGTVTDATPDTLARTSVLESSNADAAVDWGAGVKTLAVIMAGADLPVGPQELFFPAAAMVSATTSGAADGSVETTTNAVMIVTKDFDQSSDEYAQFSFQAPSNFDLGTVTFRALWSHTSGGTMFGVAWALQAQGVGNDDAIDTAWGTAVVVTDTGGTADDQYISGESGAITIANVAAGDMLYFRVFRDVSDGGDDLDLDARLHGIMLTLTVDAGNVG